MIAAAALCGVVVGFGVVLFVLGARGTDRALPRRAPSFARITRGSHRVVLALVAAALVGVVTRWPVGAGLAAAFGFASPAVFGGAASRKAAVARTEAIAAWTEMLRDTMAAAAGIEQAIVSTAPVAPPAIRVAVLNLATRLERDRLGPALRRVAEDLGDPTGDLVVAALVLASEKQAQRLGELLGALASSARQQANMRLRVDAGRARTRTASRVITIFTLGFALGLVILNRGYLVPYDGLRGQLVLAVVGLCFGTAFWWLSAMARVEPPERFLLPRGEHAT